MSESETPVKDSQDEAIPSAEAVDTPVEEVSEEEEELSPLDLPPGVVDPSKTLKIPLSDIAELDNYRGGEDDYRNIEELAETLHTQGQLQPCTVRPAAKDAEHGKNWELVFGYRRKRAAEKLGWEDLRCEVRDLDDIDVMFKMATENLQREDPSALHEAYLYKAMLDTGLTQKEVAQQLSKHQTHISHRLALLRLSEPVRAKVAEGKISASVAETIASLDKPEEQEKLANLAVKHDFTTKKAQAWANEVKASEVSPDLGPASMGIIEMVQPEDVTDLLHLVVRPDVSDEQVARIQLYSILRNGMDYEVLDFLAEEYGYPYDHLWDYVRLLKDEDVAILNKRMAIRFVSAAHRYYALEPTLKEDLSLPTEAAEDEQAKAALAAALELPGEVEDDEWEDWEEDWDDEDAPDEEAALEEEPEGPDAE
jgi:ParB/RepB/Spo0J family partition protein